MNRHGIIYTFAICLIGFFVVGTSSPITATLKRKTVITRWDPFATNGTLKRKLTVLDETGGNCDRGSPKIGDIGYRCGYSNYILNACWRDGPEGTAYVICVDPPWSNTAVRLRVPRLLMDPGFTYGRPTTIPWGIELLNGHKCDLVEGAHDSVVEGGRRYIVDYYCQYNVSLLRGIYKHTGIWTIGAVTYRNGRYGSYRIEKIKRVYFATTPPSMTRQNEMIQNAVKLALSSVRRSSGYRPTVRNDVTVAWVRATLPKMTWARVRIRALSGQHDVTRDIYLRCIRGKWQVEKSRKVCERTTSRQKAQLGARCSA